MPCLNNKGFTLVEVLVASVILFSTVSIGTLAYRTCLHSLQRVTANTAAADVLPAVVELVKADLFEGKFKGRDRFNSRVAYRFTAEKLQDSRNIRSYPDEFTGGMQYGGYTIALYGVDLRLEFQDQDRTRTSSYAYQELLWSK